MLRFLATVIATVLLIAGGPAIAKTQLALVIANSDYNLDGTTATPFSLSQTSGFVTDLRNPRNDGRRITTKLRELGFRVTIVEDATRERMIAELVQFGAQIAESPRDSIIVIYYSGHAMQVNGANFLIPAAARIPMAIDVSRLPSQQAETMIANYTVTVNDIFAQLINPSAGGLNIIILDACRNNPWEQRLNGRSRSVASRSLAEQAPSLRRTLVAYSTAPGDVASDGEEIDGANSPYTGALLRWLDRPGLTVLDMLNNVGREVVDRTGQVPWMNNAPIENLCLAGCTSSPMQSATQTDNAGGTALFAGPVTQILTLGTGESATLRINERSGIAVLVERGRAPALLDYDQAVIRDLDSRPPLTAPSLTPMFVQTGLSEPPPTFPNAVRFMFVQAPGTRRSVLIIENGYERALYYRAAMQLQDRFSQTDVCMVPPNRRAYEHWPHEIIRIDLSQFLLSQWVDSQGIRCE